MNVKWSEISTKDDSCISVLDELEQQSETLRSIYFSWLIELGNKKIDGVTISDYFSSSDGMSYWSMSLLMEKSPFKSNSAIDCLKLLALEKIIISKRLSKIRIMDVMSVTVKSAIVTLCNNLSVNVKFNSTVSLSERAGKTKAIYIKIPHVIRGAIVLMRRIFSCWRMRPAKIVDWFTGEDTVFLMSYFIHLDKSAYEQGRFESHHWGTLPDMVVSNGKKLNCLHHFIAHKHIPNVKEGLEWMSSFNRDTNQNNKHSFVDSYLTVSLIVRSAVRWVRVVWKSWRLRDFEKYFRPEDSAIDFWPILKSDWHSSFRGVAAAQNILWVELFDKAMTSLPKQRIGLYLYEGQTWEPAFVHAWRKHGHGKLIAVAHSTVRYWDLRYFNDPRILDTQFRDSLTIPDKIAVNGIVAREMLLAAGYPEEYLVDVEALRYLHLATGVQSLNKDQTVEVINSKMKLLILGDIQAINNHPLFELLAALPLEQTNSIQITVKPHPGNHVDHSDYPEVDYAVTTRPLKYIMGEFDLVFGANQTSANLDVYLFGLTVIVYRAISTLNFSPLKDISDVQFVSTSDELAIVLKNHRRFIGEIEPGKDYFYLTPELTKWKKLLLEKRDEKTITMKGNK